MADTIYTNEGTNEDNGLSSAEKDMLKENILSFDGYNGLDSDQAHSVAGIVAESSRKHHKIISVVRSSN